MRRLLVTANVIPSSPILATLMADTLNSSETSVLTRATRRNTPEDGIRQDSFVETDHLLAKLQDLVVKICCSM
jgi:hypothetical protein